MTQFGKHCKLVYGGWNMNIVHLYKLLAAENNLLAVNIFSLSSILKPRRVPAQSNFIHNLPAIHLFYEQ